jgi:hypothetical protein
MKTMLGEEQDLTISKQAHVDFHITPPPSFHSAFFSDEDYSVSCNPASIIRKKNPLVHNNDHHAVP